MDFHCAYAAIRAVGMGQAAVGKKLGAELRHFVSETVFAFVRRDCVMKVNNFGRSYLDIVLADNF